MEIGEGVKDRKVALVQQTEREENKWTKKIRLHMKI